jgi:hypothetical protein
LGPGNLSVLKSWGMGILAGGSLGHTQVHSQPLLFAIQLNTSRVRAMK